MKTWRRTLADPVYQADVELVICARAELPPILRAAGYPSSMLDGVHESHALGSVFEGRLLTYTQWFLWFPKRPSTETLQHECFHLAVRVLRDRGLELTAESEEAYAYYFSAVCREVERQLPTRGRKDSR